MVQDILAFGISIHAPTRGATGVSMSPACFALFQSTLPREERLYKTTAELRKAIFQSTLPREERLPFALHRKGRAYFNPRSHERSDFLMMKMQVKLYLISIHAPTRGATKMAELLQTNAYISIHAPTRGATAILHKKFVYFYTIPTINI